MTDGSVDAFDDLRADCSRCVGLCCVAPAFTASADFAIDKPAGQACPNLLADSRCGIHAELRPRGFTGCVVFDCFGAGQRVTQVTFRGQDWRQDPAIAASMFVVFTVMRQLHESLWYVTQAQNLIPAGGLRTDLGRAREEITRRAGNGPAELAAFDSAGFHQSLGALLRRVSDAVRASHRGKNCDYAGADLIGRSLRGADLRGASLRGAYLIGADLRSADLRLADLLGADLRAADVSGADLATSIFVTQPQLNAARGDAATMIPAALTRPAHWSVRAAPEVQPQTGRPLRPAGEGPPVQGT